jgi:hypothetical protein
MIRSTLCLLLLATAASTLSAQAPIERRTPPPPIGLAAWPQADSVKPGTNLLVTTKSPFAPSYTCRLKHLDATGIVCHNRHEQQVVFDRDLVATITQAPAQPFHLGQRYFAVTLTMIVIGTTCAILGGGIPCSAIGVAGLLGSLGGLLIDSVAGTVSVFQGPHTFTPIYIAPPPPALLS